MNRLFSVTLLVFFLAVKLRGSPPEENPSELLKNLRSQQANRYFVASGKVRHGSETSVFQVTFNGGTVRYEFDDPKETLIVRLGSRRPRLAWVYSDGHEHFIPEKWYARSFRRTALTYEDLSLRFLYWPAARLDGEQTVMTRPCRILRLSPGEEDRTQYAFARVWIEKQNGGSIRFETTDKSNLVKRFEIRAVRKIDDYYVLKRMRVDSSINGKPASKDPTWIDIDEFQDRTPKSSSK